MTKRTSPHWQPISQLPLLVRHINGVLLSANKQHGLLQLARSRPYILDDDTVGRVKEVFTTQQGDLWLFDEQLERWKALPLTAAQRQEVERLSGQMQELHTVIAAILELAKELEQGTIERQLAKSDLELGLEVLRNPDLLRRNKRGPV